MIRNWDDAVGFSLENLDGGVVQFRTRQAGDELEGEERAKSMGGNSGTREE
jgi:hypothetical protein